VSVATLSNASQIQFPTRRAPQEPTRAGVAIHTNVDCYQPGTTWMDNSNPEMVIFQFPSANAPEAAAAQTFAVPTQKAPVLEVRDA